ncbi:MAG TPA: hypothetical protein PKE06_12670 [Flavilitoribacter sp.]|nr:hypothetical protein [Flavilitoribacter sp.]
MYYLNSKHIQSIPRDWDQLALVIEEAVSCMGNEDFAQPVKPYLRYRNLQNRIIAMPAFIGGQINFSGIKWIASFPGNLEKGEKRAHSVSILNEADTGIPRCMINTPIISGIRTAAVTGAVIKKVMEARGTEQKDLIAGMTGFGPIGQMHLEMLQAILGNNLKEVRIFDIRPFDEVAGAQQTISGGRPVSTFEEASNGVDIFITATVSDKPYFNRPPKPGSLHLNVSLRDYVPDFMDFVDLMIVDDWDEVCREKTDIEMMAIHKGLKKEDTVNLVDVFCNGALNRLDQNEVVMFNPMGMAVFDIAIGAWYYEKAKELAICTILED